MIVCFFFSSRRRHTRCSRDWSSDVCSSDLGRTNSILLRSDNPGRIALLRSLIERLDVPARAIGSTRVIYLKHAEATKLVEVLRGMLSAAPGAPAQTAAPGAGGRQIGRAH